MDTPSDNYKKELEELKAVFWHFYEEVVICKTESHAYISFALRYPAIETIDQKISENVTPKYFLDLSIKYLERLEPTIAQAYKMLTKIERQLLDSENKSDKGE